MSGCRHAASVSNLPREYKKVPPHVKDDNVIPSVSELPSLFNAMRHPRKRAVSIGPQSAADAYETLAYREKRRKESVSSVGPVSPAGEGLDYTPERKASLSGPTLTSFEPTSTGFSTTIMTPLENGPAQPLTSKLDPTEQPMRNGNGNFPSWHMATETLEAGRFVQTEQKQNDREDHDMFSRLERQRVRYDVEVVTKLIVYTGEP